MWRSARSEKWMEKGKRRSCVLYFKWVVEKPACPLGAGRGGACGVWDSRQRRHIHTDTGSLERKEKQTAGDNLQLLEYFVVFRKTCQKKKESCQLYGSACELRDVCVEELVAIRCL